MSEKTIKNAEELKSLYLEIDITNIADVQSAMKEINENVCVAGKEKYIDALNAATPSNISKARRYNNASTPMRYLGWGVIVVFFAMAVMFDDSGIFEESTVTWPYLGIWVGIGIQIYIAVLKSAWDKLTLSGAVIHPALKCSSLPNRFVNNESKKYTEQTPLVEQEETVIFCSNCGCKNKSSAQFCKNCGMKL